MNVQLLAQLLDDCAIEAMGPKKLMSYVNRRDTRGGRFSRLRAIRAPRHFFS
jgi:hypothetical protein